MPTPPNQHQTLFEQALGLALLVARAADEDGRRSHAEQAAVAEAEALLRAAGHAATCQELAAALVRSGLTPQRSDRQWPGVARTIENILASVAAASEAELVALIEADRQERQAAALAAAVASAAD